MNPEYRDQKKESRRNVLIAIGLPCTVVCLGILIFGFLTGNLIPLFTAQPSETPTATATPTITLTSTPTPSPTLDVDCTTYDCLQACMERLPGIVPYLNPGLLSRAETPQAGEKAGYYILADYSVSGDQVVAQGVSLPVPVRLAEVQQDTELHEGIWDFYAAIFPEQVRSWLTSYEVYTDGQNIGSAAFLNGGPANFTLGLDLFDLFQNHFFLSTLAHESAHLMTMNNSQVRKLYLDFHQAIDYNNFYATAGVCGNYFNGTRCAYGNSYINRFYQRFWKDKGWPQIFNIYYAEYIGNPTDPIASALYTAHPDEFLSEYAATSPDEDIAVSFESFVFGQRSSLQNYIVDEKIDFFYEFPELVEIRGQIIRNLCRYAANVSSQ